MWVVCGDIGLEGGMHDDVGSVLSHCDRAMEYKTERVARSVYFVSIVAITKCSSSRFIQK